MKICKEGYSSILITLIITALIFLLLFHLTGPSLFTYIFTGALLLLVIFLLSFFREPVRHPIGDSHLVTAPADGKIVIIKEVEEPEYFHGKRLQVSVFMSVFNVHINWVPVRGKVSFYKYHPGNYLVAWHPKSSTKNERTTVVFRNEDGTEIMCRQIAGLLARRVVCYAEFEKHMNAGEKLGFIKFGSRADLFLPIGTKLNVSIGDKVTGAETIMAELPRTINE